MFNLKLKGNLESDLIALGLKEGDIISAEKCSVSTVGAMHFTVYKNSFSYDCSVWPENYDVIN